VISDQRESIIGRRLASIDTHKAHRGSAPVVVREVAVHPEDYPPGARIEIVSATTGRPAEPDGPLDALVFWLALAATVVGSVWVALHTLSYSTLQGPRPTKVAQSVTHDAVGHVGFELHENGPKDGSPAIAVRVRRYVTSHNPAPNLPAAGGVRRIGTTA
jgi:hypothetical protein